MVKKFLKIAGVKTQAEFYKKYPSEEAFFRAHPEARDLVNQKMAYGGMYAYNRGGSYPSYQGDIGSSTVTTVPPLRQQYDDDAAWQEALFNYAASQQQPSSFIGPMQDASSNVLSSSIPAEMFYSNIDAVPQLLPSYAEPVASQYKGVSIVDMLASKGKSDFKTRKEIAKALGIKGYKGTADQNLQMISLLNQNPDALNQVYTSTPSQTSSLVTPLSSDTSRQQASSVPSVVTPSTATTNNFSIQYPETFRYSSNKNDGFSMLLPGAAVVGAGAAGLYGLNKAAKASVSAAKNAAALTKASLTTDDIIKMAQKTGREAETWQLLKARGMSDFDIAKSLKGIKFKGSGSAGVPEEYIDILKGGLNKLTAAQELEIKNIENAKRLIQVYKDQGLARTPELLNKVSKLVPNPAKAATLLKGVGFPKTAVEAASKASKVEKTLGLGSRIAEGINAFGKLKYVEPLVNFYRGFVKEDGGESDYSGTYSGGVYYQEGGAYVPHYGDNAYGVLPKYGMGAMGVPPAMYGMGMKDGGQNNTLQKFVNAGYNLDYLAQGGPTYSKNTVYNHQGIVPAFDWLKEGGPTFSKHTGYPHQKYVPALDWLQEGGTPISADGAQQQGPDPQQVMQAVSQMLQQGIEPGQILQELVKTGVPQEMAQQIIQQIMQQMQGIQQQFQQAGPMMKSGGLVKGSVHDVSEKDVQDLINKGYKIQYL